MNKKLALLALMAALVALPSLAALWSPQASATPPVSELTVPQAFAEPLVSAERLVSVDRGDVLTPTQQASCTDSTCYYYCGIGGGQFTGDIAFPCRCC